MSFSSIYECAANPDFRDRVTACAVSLGVAPAGGEAFTSQNVLEIAARKEIADAWALSLEACPFHSRRGYDEAIISDQMIRRAVRAITKPNMPEPEPEPELGDSDEGEVRDE